MTAVDLLLPAICLGALGWLVPRVLALVFPEGVKPLIVLAFIAAVLMTVLAMGVFLLLYVIQGISIAEFFSLGVGEGLAHLVRISAASGLIWAPMLILSVSGLPKHWVKETW